MTKNNHQRQVPGVVFQPQVRQGIGNGIDSLVDAIAPTLGPLPRMVANEKINRSKRPELLDNGAVIARRILMLPNRTDDVGAMYLRQMLWRVSELVGDGTATAAVLFRSIFNHGVRYLVAGGNAMRLRRYLESAVQPLLDALDEMAVSIDTQEQIEGLALSVCHDGPVASALAQAFATIGVYGRLEIRSGHGREIEQEYFEGTYWDHGLVKPAGISPQQEIALADAPILVTDFDVENPHQLIPLFVLAVRAGIKQLIVLVANISDAALTALTTPKNKERVELIFVKAPISLKSSSRDELNDLALLVGANPFIEKGGLPLENIQLSDLGYARRFWANKTSFGVIGGQGDSCQLRQHITRLKQLHWSADDGETRQQLYNRLNKLISGTAILQIGALSTIEVENRRDTAQNTAETVRTALSEGVVPGGGVALLRCIADMQHKAGQTHDADERAAYHLLQQALEAPFRAILQNAGYAPDFVLARLSQYPENYGFDVIRGEAVDMIQSGIADSVSVIKTALRSAVYSAALALTIDTVVHRANPPEAVQP
ncbi:MAG: hypothetical protein JW963_08780 [Anaerolineales bacterium]|jgi:chaperonin GroEL|nr:hypothetical protein [Anaerolineales bacterium]